MSDRTQLGLGILGAALALGIAADLLLRAIPWGLNFALWTAGLAAALVLLGRHRNQAPKNGPWTGGGAWLLAAVIAFSAAFAWHDSLTLALLNLLAILIALALLVLRARGGLLWPASLIDYASGAVLAAANTAIGPLLVLFDCVRWTEILTRRSLRRTAAAGVGLLIAFPALVIFGGLLASADPVFKGLLRRLLHVISWSALSHVLLAGFAAWIVSGFLRGFLLGPPGLLSSNPTVAGGRAWSFPKLGIIEIGVALGALDLLFLAFVLVQIRYLFGGAKLVNVTSGLTYAEYARSGFFELVAVATLSLPLLLLAHWLLNQEDPRHRRMFGALAGLQIALLFVIMASAFERMRLYQSEYGLTEA
ncbi:MAG TPA: DUF4173 domain-containing protein, partial [Terriglobia bacterium]|nr:DUF4173 domain-containing protein [Terriglobia bacterium]